MDGAHDDDIFCRSYGMKLKFNKGIQLLGLDGKWMPFEEAGGELAIVQFRMFACAAKDKDGTNTGAYLCLSIVEGTEIKQGENKLPNFEADDLSAPSSFDIPAAGSGSAPSPDEPAAAAEPAASAGKASKRGRARAD